jgi:hypothetical protein
MASRHVRNDHEWDGYEVVREPGPGGFDPSEPTGQEIIDHMPPANPAEELRRLRQLEREGRLP